MEKFFDKNPKYIMRKLTVGLVSVILGVSIIIPDRKSYSFAKKAEYNKASNNSQDYINEWNITPENYYDKNYKYSKYLKFIDNDSKAKKNDTDGDGINDYLEVKVFKTDPTFFNVDTDGDKIPDVLEVMYYGTDPNNVDTDGDGKWDGIYSPDNINHELETYEPVKDEGDKNTYKIKGTSPLINISEFRSQFNETVNPDNIKIWSGLKGKVQPYKVVSLSFYSGENRKCIAETLSDKDGNYELKIGSLFKRYKFFKKTNEFGNSAKLDYKDNIIFEDSKSYEKIIKGKGEFYFEIWEDGFSDTPKEINNLYSSPEIIPVSRSMNDMIGIKPGTLVVPYGTDLNKNQELYAKGAISQKHFINNAVYSFDDNFNYNITKIPGEYNVTVKIDYTNKNEEFVKNCIIKVLSINESVKNLSLEMQSNPGEYKTKDLIEIINNYFNNNLTDDYISINIKKSDENEYLNSTNYIKSITNIDNNLENINIISGEEKNLNCDLIFTDGSKLLNIPLKIYGRMKPEAEIMETSVTNGIKVTDIDILKTRENTVIESDSKEVNGLKITKEGKLEGIPNVNFNKDEKSKDVIIKVELKSSDGINEIKEVKIKVNKKVSEINPAEEKVKETTETEKKDTPAEEKVNKKVNKFSEDTMYINKKSLLKNEKSDERSEVNIAINKSNGLFNIIKPKNANNGLIHLRYLYGYDDNTIRLSNELTRAEASTMFARLLNNGKIPAGNVYYKDLENKFWAMNSIAYLSSNGYINGYKDGTFKADSNITRAEFAQMVSKYLKNNSNNICAPFNDINDHWAIDAINSLYSSNLINGYEDGMFRPDNIITREEAIKIFNILFERPSTLNNLSNIRLEDIENNYYDLDKNRWSYNYIVDALKNHKITRKDDNIVSWEIIAD